MAVIEKAATYKAPGREGSPLEFKYRYENFIGHWVPPAKGECSENRTPATGEPFTEVPKSTAEDIELAPRRRARGEDHRGERSPIEHSKVLS